MCDRPFFSLVLIAAVIKAVAIWIALNFYDYLSLGSLAWFNVSALKRFYREPKRLALGINPPNALDFSALVFYDAKDAPVLLNLKIVASQ